MGTTAPIKRITTEPKRVGNPFLVPPDSAPEEPHAPVTVPQREPVPA
jgi:hypothetical protein